MIDGLCSLATIPKCFYPLTHMMDTMQRQYLRVINIHSHPLYYGFGIEPPIFGLRDNRHVQYVRLLHSSILYSQYMDKMYLQDDLIKRQTASLFMDYLTCNSLWILILLCSYLVSKVLYSPRLMDIYCLLFQLFLSCIFTQNKAICFRIRPLFFL